MRKSKLDDKGEVVVYLGTCNGLYRVYIPRRVIIVTTRHANFDEERFPLDKQIERDSQFRNDETKIEAVCWIRPAIKR